MHVPCYWLPIDRAFFPLTLINCNELTSSVMLVRAINASLIIITRFVFFCMMLVTSNVLRKHQAFLLHAVLSKEINSQNALGKASG